MDELRIWCGLKVLITTASQRSECQQWAWWDAADVIIQMDTRGAVVLKGQLC